MNYLNILQDAKVTKINEIRFKFKKFEEKNDSFLEMNIPSLIKCFDELDFINKEIKVNTPDFSADDIPF